MSRRTLTLTLFALATVAVVGLAANAIFVRNVESRVEGSLENRLDSPVDVDLSGFPATPRLLAGSLPAGEIAVEDLGLPGTEASLGSLDATLTDVR